MVHYKASLEHKDMHGSNLIVWSMDRNHTEPRHLRIAVSHPWIKWRVLDF